MHTPRVVSLAPSATATLDAMDAADLLVGVTHHCDPGASTGAAHGAGAPHDASPVGGWLDPNLDRVADLDPDLVCTSDGLQAEVADACRERGLRVSHAEPATLADVLERFRELGAAVGREAAGEALTRDARDRLDAVADAVAHVTMGSVTSDHVTDDVDRPVVYCEEWSDPPMAAGNWVPDAVGAAGGRYPFVEPGERSRKVDARAVEAADPDHVVLHVCGHGDRVDPAVVHDRGWAIDAPVHVLDDSLLNQPSPALIDGIERLAAWLHPDAFS